MRIRLLAVLMALSVVVPAGAQTQPTSTPAPTPAPTAPPCSTPEYRQLDFWVGEWIATWTNPNGSTGTGRNTITRDEYGPCVITERFVADDGSLRGLSISTYFQSAREWRQTWMDEQGGYFDLFGGPSTTAGQRLVLEQYRRQETAPHLRMVWENVEPNSFTWRWQRRSSPTAAWADSWVIRYVRAPSSR